jgi:hypothetical protein
MVRYKVKERDFVLPILILWLQIIVRSLRKLVTQSDNQLIKNRL